MADRSDEDARIDGGADFHIHLAQLLVGDLRIPRTYRVVHRLHLRSNSQRCMHYLICGVYALSDLWSRALDMSKFENSVQ